MRLDHISQSDLEEGDIVIAEQPKFSISTMVFLILRKYEDLGRGLICYRVWYENTEYTQDRYEPSVFLDGGGEIIRSKRSKRAR